MKVGAHPSLPDRQGFGRRGMKMEREEITNCVIYQIGALKAVLDGEAMPLHRIKPHRSLFGMASRDPAVAHAICDVADLFKVPLIGLINTEHKRIYIERGHRFFREVNLDLDHPDGGTLIVTRHHAAVDPAAAAVRVLSVSRDGTVKSVGGKDIPVGIDTMCIHCNTPGTASLEADHLHQPHRGNAVQPVIHPSHRRPRWRRVRGGSILNFVSLSGRKGGVGWSAYGTSKAGLEVLTKITAVEFADHGIRVNAIAPSPITTETGKAMHARRRTPIIA